MFLVIRPPAQLLQQRAPVRPLEGRNCGSCSDTFHTIRDPFRWLSCVELLLTLCRTCLSVALSLTIHLLQTNDECDMREVVQPR
jgi:hypothetical protein